MVNHPKVIAKQDPNKDKESFLWGFEKHLEICDKILQVSTGKIKLNFQQNKPKHSPMYLQR